MILKNAMGAVLEEGTLDSLQLTFNVKCWILREMACHLLGLSRKHVLLFYDEQDIFSFLTKQK